MARVYKRGKIWYVDYTLRGQRKRKRVGTSKKLTKDVLKDIEGKLVLCQGSNDG